MGYVSHAQRKAVWASKKDGGKGNPNSPAKMKTAKQKAGGSFDKPVGTKAGADKRKAILAKVKKEGEAKVSASAKKSPVEMKKGNKTMDARRKRNEAKPRTQTVDARRRRNEANTSTRANTNKLGIPKSPFKLKPKSPLMGKISASCKARAKKKFKVWPSAYASGWGVRCTQGKV